MKCGAPVVTNQLRLDGEFWNLKLTRFMTDNESS